MSNDTRLVLLVPKGLAVDDLVQKLRAAFAGGPIDAVILPLPDVDDRAKINYAKAAAEIVQSHGAALVVDGEFEIVARAGADGVHIATPQGLEAAIDRDPKHERMIGVGGIRTRHEAMEVAEAGADYVMFGEPRPDGYVPPFDQTLDAAGWWAELFNTPGIGFVAEIGEVGMMASSGIEFVALGSAVFDYAEGPTLAVQMVHDQIANAPAPEWAQDQGKGKGRKGR